MKVFVDTNILVYAHDRGAGDKHARALNLVERLWRDAEGIVSTQVLQELYVNIRRKAQRPVSHAEARAVANDYLAWDPVVNDGAAVLDAIDLEARFKLPFGMRSSLWPPKTAELPSSTRKTCSTDNVSVPCAPRIHCG